MNIRLALLWLSRLSAIGLIAIAVLWIRSYFVYDYVAHDSRPTMKHVELTSFKGELTVTTTADVPSDANGWAFDRYPLYGPDEWGNTLHADGERLRWYLGGVGKSEREFIGVHVRQGRVPEFGGAFCTIALRHAHLAVPLVIGAVPALYPWWSRRRRRKLIKSGRCPHCGYDLRETSDRCPECGHSPQAV